MNREEKHLHIIPPAAFERFLAAEETRHQNKMAAKAEIELSRKVVVKTYFDEHGRATHSERIPTVKVEQDE